MTREPSYHGVPSGEAITLHDGTWPLPPELVRELHPGMPEPRLAPPVEVLRGKAPAPAPESRVNESSALPAFPRPARPARPPGLPPVMQALWKEVLERHDALAQLDHFGVLEIPYDSGSAHVQQAFSQLVARFHPDKLPAEIELLKPYAVRIVARLNVARMTLSGRAAREAYLRSLGLPVPAPSAEPALPTAETRPVARVALGKERRVVPGSAPGWKAAREESVPVRSRQPEPAPAASARFFRALRRNRPSSA